MPFFYNEEDYKTLVFLNEASVNVFHKKHARKPVIVVRSSYEHQLGNENTRSNHRAGIKLKKGSIYGKDGLEVYTRDDKNNVKATLAKNSDGYDEKSDEKIVKAFIKKYYKEIERIYDAKPNTKEYEEAINDFLELGKSDKEFIMKKDDK